MADQFKFAGMDGADEVTISAIHVSVGQDIKKGDNLFDVEADKASETITSTVEGKISSIAFQPGDSIKKGEVFLEVGGSATASETVSTTAPDKPKAEAQAPASEVKPVEIATPSSPATTTHVSDFVATGPVLATPIARKVARDLGIDLTRVKGTGPNGRVLRTDVEAAKNGGNSSTKTIKSTNAASQSSTVATTSSPSFAPTSGGAINVAKIESFGQVEHMPLTGLRKAVANAMSTSVYTAPHVSLMTDLDATNLMNLRASVKDDLLKEGVKLTFMPFFIKAVAKALSEDRFKLFNSTLNMAGNEILVKKYYNIGMAADTEKGLVVPVIKDADKLTITEIAKQVNQLGKKARDGQLKPDEMQGGTFTITNFGSAGLKIGTPVINYPEVAILGLGTLEVKPVMINGEIAFHQFFPLSLSIDHRVIDGAPAGYFLQRIKELLEKPALLLL